MKRIYIAISFLASLSFLSFSNNLDRESRINAEIERRVELHRKQKIAECKNAAIQDAMRIVDSIIHKEIIIPSIDTIKIPERPSRPSLTDSIIIDTSKNAKPLFDG